jgi:hypothetical protein
MKASHSAAPVTTFGYVGNVGCIRFPVEIRKTSGIKRGHRLSMVIVGSHRIVLERMDVPDWMPTKALTVDGCACAQAPEGCSRADFLTVGWSYVKLDEATAQELGFLAGAAVKLVAEPSRITVSVHTNRSDLQGVDRLPCPP